MKNEYRYQFGEEIKTVTIERDGDRFRVTIDDKLYNLAAERLARGQLNLVLDNRHLQIHVAHNGPRHYVAMDGETWVLERPQAQSRRRGGGAAVGSGSGSLEAGMPGLVLDVPVSEGDLVERGQTLVLLEAMKMELRISAPFAGQVAKIHCVEGQVVERGQLLVELEEENS